MEKRNHTDLALEFFESIQEMTPDYPDIHAKIDALISTTPFKSKYDYLIRYKLVTKEQLEKALDLSKKTRKSVEFILIEQIRIKKEEVGKSLSLFYKCPFKAFDDKTPVPYELLTKVKKAFLLQNTWVPLSWEMTTGEVEILIDNPADITKTDYISTLIKAKRIKLAVGIQEDILATINSFFDQKGENTERRRARR